jgi:GR25 family glycosyltransferase involved in LPS biosynthesis
VLLLAAHWIYFYLLPKLIPGPHSNFDDVFWRAFLLMPWSYLKIHLWDPQPPTGDFQYKITNENSFVINLNQDQQRWQHFGKTNHLGTRFSASDLSQPGVLATPTTRKYIAMYPNMGALVAQRRYGEAGCFLSHVRALQQVLDNNLTYAFIFEDDAILLRPNLTIVEAPSPVDFVFLTTNVLRATRMKHGIRVMGGAGTYGLMVTQRGATKMLQLLRRGSCGIFDQKKCKTDPIDIALMKYAARYGLEIYLPVGWPLVKHSKAFQSSKMNKQKKGGR